MSKWNASNPKKFKPNATTATIKEARDWLWRAFKAREYAQCPCCTTVIHEDVRSMDHGKARALLFLYRCDPNGLVNISNLPDSEEKQFKNWEGEKLRHWGLIERPEDATERVWRLTELGRDFANGDATVEEKIHHLGRRFLKKSGKQVSIREALGKKFDLDELLHGPV